MSTRPLAASILIAAVLWAGAAGAPPARAPPAGAQLGGHANETTQPPGGRRPRPRPGRTVRLEDQKGKALLLFFWATW